jgi:Fic family protein
MINRDNPYNDLQDLPPKIDLNNPELLRAAIRANRLLAELKGYCQTLPNPLLLINTIVLQESKNSSAIENIVTTQDELYRAIVSIGSEATLSSNDRSGLKFYL